MKPEEYKKYYRITTDGGNFRIERNYPRWFMRKDNWKADSDEFPNHDWMHSAIIERLRRRGIIPPVEWKPI